jgi:hypothetical protein
MNGGKTTMDTRLITGLAMAAGAAGYCAWGFIQAYNETKGTKQEEKFNWTKATMTVLPSVVGGFVAGYAMESSPEDLVALVFAGFGAASVGNKLGINSFFD